MADPESLWRLYRQRHGGQDPWRVGEEPVTGEWPRVQGAADRAVDGEIMGSSHKQAARKYQREHPGVTFPEAKRAVARPASGSSPAQLPDQVPWVRRLKEHHDVAPCFFCGLDTLTRSAGDVSVDPKRTQVYCDNDQCDAREIEVIVVGDDTQSTRSRTDVRILQRFAPIADRPASSLIEEIGDWIPGATPAGRTQPTVCLFCGEPTCVPASDDVVGDTGRLRLRCTNAACGVAEMEVLVMRDGTPWTQSRDDVRALNAIIPRRGGTSVGEEIVIYRVSDLRFTPEEVLAGRLSGPFPPGNGPDPAADDSDRAARFEG